MRGKNMDITGFEYKPGHHINGSLPQGWDKNNKPNPYVEFSGVVIAKSFAIDTYHVKLDEPYKGFTVLAIHDSNIRDKSKYNP